MPLAIADPTQPPIFFLNPAVISSPASRQNLLALHIEFYPHYVVANPDNLSRDQIVDRLTQIDLDFVADGLHETWSFALDTSVRLESRVAVWPRPQSSSDEPLSYLGIECMALYGTLRRWNMSGHVVFCNRMRGFDEKAFERARMILLSQIPIPVTMKEHPRHP